MTRRSTIATAAAALASAAHAGVVAQSAPGYEPGPDHYRVPASALASLFEPPYDVRLEWIGDSFVAMVAPMTSRLPFGIANVMDWRDSPTGGFAAVGMVPRWNPRAASKQTPNHIEASTELTPTGFDIVSQSEGWSIYAEDNRYSLHIDASWWARAGSYWRDTGVQHEFLRFGFDQQRGFQGGFNRLYGPGDALAFRGLLIAPEETAQAGLWDNLMYLVDVGGTDPQTALPLLGGADPAIYRGRAFRYDRSSFRTSWAPGASMLQLGRTDPEPGRLNSIWFTAPGGVAGDAPVLARDAAGDPVMALRSPVALKDTGKVLSWTGGVLYRAGPDGRPLPGPYCNTTIGVNSASLADLGGPTPNTPDSKNFTPESLRDWYWHTTLRPEQDTVVFICYAAETGTPAFFEQTITNLFRTIGSAFASFEGFTGEVSIVFVVPQLHILTGLDLVQSVAEFNTMRDAALVAADNARLEGYNAGVVSVYDYFDGVIFNGTQDARDYLSSVGADQFTWGDGNEVDLIAQTNGRLLDASDLHVTSDSPHPGAFIATGFRDALRDAYVTSLCPADINTRSTNPGDPELGTPDGLVDGADLSYFVENWLAFNRAVADITTKNVAPDDPAWGEPDGVVDGVDLSYFVETWLGACL